MTDPQDEPAAASQPVATPPPEPAPPIIVPLPDTLQLVDHVYERKGLDPDRVERD